MQNYDRIRFVTEYFSSLQGLRLIPFWLFSALLNAAVLLRVDSIAILVFGLAGVVVTFFVVQPWFDRYYRERFGSVESKVSRAQAILGGFLVACILIDLFLRLPINMTALGIGVFTLYLAWGSRGLLPHYAVFGAVMLALSVLVTGLDRDTHINVVMLAVSLLSLVSGALDHVALNRLMPPVSEDHYVESI
jgi:asparagine N-glycosylation enzyme membrane subunit Stt3